MKSEFGYNQLLENGTESVVVPEAKIQALIDLFTEYAGNLEEAKSYDGDLRESYKRAELIKGAEKVKKKFREDFVNLSPVEKQRCIDAITLEAELGSVESQLQKFLAENADLLETGE